jgi:putative ABC transport system permease protein
MLELAARNIRESMLRNVLTTVGIAVGVASLVSMLSLGVGLQELASTRMNQSGLFDTIMVSSKRGGGSFQRPGPPGAPREESDADSENAPILDEAARQELGRIAGVREVYPEVRFPAEFNYGDKPFRRVVVGTPFSAQENEAFRAVEGRFFSSETAAEAVLNEPFAAELLGKGRRGRGAKDAADPTAKQLASELVGKTIRLRYAERSSTASSGDASSPDAFLGGLSVAWREVDLKIVGVIARDPQQMPGRGSAGVLAPLKYVEGLHVMDASDLRDSLRSMGAAAPTYTMLTVKLKNPAEVGAVQDRVKTMGFNTFSIVDATSGLRQVFLIMDSFLGAFGSLALTVASIGIVNTLIMAILERRREIGVMKALGASDRDVRRLFFAEAGTLGLVGGAMGVTLGWLIGRGINFGVNFYLDRQGLPPQEIWRVPWWLVAGAILFAVLTSLVAGWYPAKKAAELDPIQALRYE